jgi:glycosyltransferase involved in cell wall biosynthesis
MAVIGPTGTEAVFLVQVPTPYLSPCLDALHEYGLGVSAAYHSAGDDHRGWGAVVPRHPHAVIPPGLISASAFLIRRMLDPRVRVLCCFGYNHVANCLAVLVARARGVPVVIRSDSNWLQERLRPPVRIVVKRWALRLIFGRRARVWTIGSQNDRYWAEYGMSDRHRIPFGIPRAPIGTPAQRVAFRTRHDLGSGLVVLYVGVLEPWKGVDVLLDAFAVLDAPSARLVVVGQGSMNASVERAAASDHRIRRTGPLTQEELPAAYAAADLLVLPSRRESWGLVVDEAQANGLRVVVSDIAGCVTDRVRPGIDWSFPAGDATGLRAILGEAVNLHERGWRAPPPCRPPDGTAEMIADLTRLGIADPRTAR